MDHEVSVIEPFEDGGGLDLGIGSNIEVRQEDGDVRKGHIAEPKLAPSFGDAFDGGEEGCGKGEEGEGGQLRRGEGGRERGHQGIEGSSGEGSGAWKGQVVAMMVEKRMKSVDDGGGRQE